MTGDPHASYVVDTAVVRRMPGAGIRVAEHVLPQRQDGACGCRWAPPGGLQRLSVLGALPHTQTCTYIHTYAHSDGLHEHVYMYIGHVYGHHFTALVLKIFR